MFPQHYSIEVGVETSPNGTGASGLSSKDAGQHKVDRPEIDRAIEKHENSTVH